MAFKKILEEQANDDSPIFSADYDKEEDFLKIEIVDSDNEVHRLYFQYEEIEDFYYFIKKVREITA